MATLKTVKYYAPLLVGLAVCAGGLACADVRADAARPAFSPLTFTSYPQAVQNVRAGLACKWVSTNSHWTERQQYDLLCTGGAWGTITVMLDKAGEGADQLGRVRLLFREWDEAAHPAAKTDGPTANDFLNFILYYFVPEKIAPEVHRSFWMKQDSTWKNRVAEVALTHEVRDGYTLHRLEITGADGLVREMEEAAEPAVQMRHKPGRQVEKMPPPPVQLPVEPRKDVSRGVQERQFKQEDVFVPADAARDIPSSLPALMQPDDLLPEVPTRELPDMQATVRQLSDKVEINGLSAGQAVFHSVRLLKERADDTPLKSTESQLRVVPPPVGEKSYQQAEELTKTYTDKVEEAGADVEKEIPGFQLTPEQVAPLLQAPEESLSDKPKKSAEVVAPLSEDLQDDSAIPAAKPWQEETPQQQKYENAEQAL